MRVITWNVNSIRSRLDRLLALLERHDVDVAAIQETKCRDDQFPELPFLAAGYEVAHHGMSQWNGVAIISRVGLDDVEIGFPGQPGWGEPASVEARAIGATVGAGDGRPLRIWSLYVPNGRHLDDPHMAYKLDWMARLRDAGARWLADDADASTLMCGDWNIAPLDDDVWSMAFYEDKSHVSAPERAAFHAVVEAGYTDIVRPFAPGPGVYTYWDYTRLRFPRAEGMRIDFVLASPAAASRVSGAMIDRQERKGAGASDHAPVVVDLAP